LKRLNLLTTHQNQISAQLRLQAAFGKKEVRTYDGEREDEDIHAKVKAYDKIYAVAKAGSAKHERSAAFAEIKEEVKALFTEELAENGDLISIFLKQIKKQFVT
jgi:polyribonucleotide nucleotidyltransferase